VVIRRQAGLQSREVRVDRVCATGGGSERGRRRRRRRRRRRGFRRRRLLRLLRPRS
jgi:hypothetical protein